MIAVLRNAALLAASMFLGIEPRPRCRVPDCAYRGYSEADRDRHERVCPWRVSV